MSLYKLLGVAKTASKLEIKVAYRKLALQFHPDKHAQSPPQARAAAAVKFRQISSAYETLADDRKRAAYDRNPSSVSVPRQPHSAQSHSRYSSASNSSGGGDGDGGLRRAIRNRDLKKILKAGLHFILWLLKNLILLIFKIFIEIIETYEELEAKREEERRKRK